MADNSSKIHEQFGYVNNLLIVLSMAFLTYLVNLSMRVKATLPFKLEKYLVMIALVTIFSSLILGVVVAWIRIDQFRVGARMNKDEVSKEDHRKNVKEYLVIERKKRRLLKYQALTLATSAFFMLIFSIISLFKD